MRCDGDEIHRSRQQRDGPGQAARPASGTGGPAQDRSGQGLLTIGFSDRHVPGTGSPLRWFFSGIWLVYLIQPVSDLFQHDHGVAWIAGGLVITVAFCVIYLPILMYSDTRPRLALYGLGALAVLAAVACVVYGKSWTPLWIYVSAATGMVLTSVYDRRQGPRSASSPSRPATCSSAGSPTSTSRAPWSCCCPSCSSAWP